MHIEDQVVSGCGLNITSCDNYILTSIYSIIFLTGQRRVQDRDVLAEHALIPG